MDLVEFINGLPKAELHLHIEGTLEPEMMLALAQRNQVSIPFQTVEEIRQAYQFQNLQEFLDIYYRGMSVLVTEQDFYDLTYAYLERCAQENVIHTELFFDPQGHTERGIAFEQVVNGVSRALDHGLTKLKITSRLIMCFLRHLDEASALATLEQAMPYRDKIIGVGLDSSELGHPPEKFNRVFAKAREAGFRCVAHAGEEGPSEYVWGAINDLKVDRIDHGNRSLEDGKLIHALAEQQIPLTVCPLSNLKLRVVNDLTHHPLLEMMNKGLMTTVNSDDPAYFGGYINKNFSQIARALNLNAKHLATLAENSFKASFLPEQEKAKHIDKVASYVVGYHDVH